MNTEPTKPATTPGSLPRRMPGLLQIVTPHPDGSVTTCVCKQNGTSESTTVSANGTWRTEASHRNPDGTIWTMSSVTFPDGTSQGTTRMSDGTTTVVVTTPDGAVSTTVTRPDGRSVTRRQPPVQSR